MFQPVNNLEGLAFPSSFQPPPHKARRLGDKEECPSEPESLCSGSVHPRVAHPTGPPLRPMGVHRAAASERVGEGVWAGLGCVR